MVLNKGVINGDERDGDRRMRTSLGHFVLRGIDSISKAGSGWSDADQAVPYAKEGTTVLLGT